MDRCAKPKSCRSTISEELQKVLPEGCTLVWTNDMSSWLQERRLRPIYELLDGGNNKKVVTEVDRLLKKQPSFPCAKVLKALALIRMNKQEEAKAILKPVAEQTPTDDATIQALSICYREIEEPSLLAEVLEAACEKEKSEELLTHCFMAQVRILDYKKMYTTAMQLYKLYNKSTYYGWAVASLVLKFDLFVGPLEKSDYVTLELAARMMEKHVAEHKTIEENMLDLQLGIMCRQGAWEKMLAALNASGYPQSQNQKLDTFHMFYKCVLERLGKYDELFDYLKSGYLQNQDEYGFLKDIIDIFGIEGKGREKTKSLMDDLCDNYPNLTVFLADLYYSKHCVDDIQQRTSRYIRSLTRVVEYDIDKPSFYPDIIDYFRELSRTEQEKYVAFIYPKPGPEGSNYDTIPNILKDANYETMNRLILNSGAENSERLKQAEICFGKYLICDGFSTSLRSTENLRTKEPDFHDQFLIITALNLLEDYHKSPLLMSDDSASIYLTRQPWTSLDPVKCPPELVKLRATLEQEKKESTLSQVDGLIEATTGLAVSEMKSRELVLVFAISVLEFGLARSPYNYTMRILLSKAYGHLGAIHQATKVIHGLDLKHVQWDSLGYLIFPQGLTAGAYTEVNKMLSLAETMYSTYKRESMEHVISAFKYGSFLKVREFISFKSELLQSIQCAQTVVEKRLLELMLVGGSSGELLKVAEASSRDNLLKGVLTESNTSDNRDFSVLQYFEDSVELQLAQDTTGNLTSSQNKLRSAFLVTIEQLVLFSRGVGSNDVQDVVKSIIAYVELAKLKPEKSSSLANGDVSCPQLHGFWPHRFSHPFMSNAASIMADQLNIVKSILLNEEQVQLQNLQTTVEGTAKAMLECVTSHKNNFSADKQSINMDSCIYALHIALETFSFTRIIAESAINIFKTRNEGVKSKSKQRDKANQSQLLKKGFQAIAKTLLDKCKEFGETVSELIEILSKRQVLKLSLLSATTKSVINSSFLSHALTSHFDHAQKTIRDSQLTQLEEIRKTASSLVDYVRVNLEPLGK